MLKTTVVEHTPVEASSPEEAAKIALGPRRYKVKFARVVIAEEEFYAKREDAEKKASDMERRGDLSILKIAWDCNGDPIQALADNVVDIQDYEHIWEVEEIE